MMSYDEVMALVKECEEEDKKTRLVERPTSSGWTKHDIIFTPRYKELFFDKEKTGLRSEEAKIFKCNECGEYVSYFDLEQWCCDFEKKNFICSLCYEEEMGADL